MRNVLVGGVTGLLAVSLAVIGLSSASANSSAGLNTFAISPSPAPTIFTGLTSQAASSETFKITNAWTAGDTIVFDVTPHDSTTQNCTSNNPNDYVVFSATPQVTAVASMGNNVSDVAPVITPTRAAIPADPSGVNCVASPHDQLTLTVSNTPQNGGNGDTFLVTVSNIAYSVGSATPNGAVNLTLTSTPAATPVSNATVQNHVSAGATANNPETVVPVSTNSAISNIVVTETAVGAVSGSICVKPTNSGETNFCFIDPAPTETASAGSGAVVGAVTIVAGQIQAVITTPSTSAATYTISGVNVGDGPTSGPANATVITGAATCGGDTSAVTTAQLNVFNSAPTINPSISGADADATAIVEMATAFPTHGCPNNITGNMGSVILATDQGFADALSASYLAGFLGSGILLTPTASLSSETQQALQTEGITNVYVVGGTFAVSQNTINQVAATPAYTCGGPSGGGALTGSNITVHSAIAGATEYDTSQLIATTPPPSFVRAINLSGAYNGAYNNSPGTESATPVASGALKTAIVANGATFQDASAASVMAYDEHFPLVLTDPSALSSQASNALTSLGVQQAIVLGGSLAVSAADVTSIQALGISVIRIAGQDGTDTAQELASFELNQSGTFVGLGWGADGVWNNTILVSRGDGFTDALAGSVLAHIRPEPLLSTEDEQTIGTFLAGFLANGGSPTGIDNLNSVGGYSGNIEAIQPLGGVLALTVPTLQAIAADVAAG